MRPVAGVTVVHLPYGRRAIVLVEIMGGKAAATLPRPLAAKVL